MYLLLSGEGPGDMGHYVPTEDSAGLVYEPGPMAWFVDQLIEQHLEFSHIRYERAEYVSKNDLVTQAGTLPKKRKSPRLPGKRRPKETSYYFENARALATLAKTKTGQLNDTVIAVLFRDADGTASAERGEWQNKFNSMKQGFASENFATGVPMIPKPKSEAWLLCTVKENPYQYCAALENESGNDNSPNPLKAQLASALDDENSTAQINERVLDRRIDVTQIDMPSFNAFREILETSVQTTMGGHAS